MSGEVSTIQKLPTSRTLLFEAKSGIRAYSLYESGVDGFAFWVENEHGEGMQLDNDELFDILHRHFEETF